MLEEVYTNLDDCDTVLTSMAMTNEQRMLRVCGCGWSKLTTYPGQQIHQGKAKCGGGNQMQTCSGRGITDRLSNTVTQNATQTVEQAISHLKHREIVGLPKLGRAGFGWGSRSKPQKGLSHRRK